MRQFAHVQRNLILPPLAILANWLIISGCIAGAIYSQSYLAMALAIIVIGARQHALFILVHEATHMHIAPNKRVNDWISDLFCALPLLFDTGVYRKNHLAHHRNLNSDQDPDWNRKQGKPGWTFPVSAGKVALFIPTYVAFLGPLEVIPVFWGFSGFGQLQRWKTEAGFLIFKLAYFSAAAFAFTKLGVWNEVILYWFVPMLFVLPFAARVRNYSEHFAITYADEHNSTREVAPSWIEGFLLTPHNVNYHLTHHLFPQLPFYRIGAAHKQLCESGFYDGAQVNNAYFFPYKNSVLKDVIHGPTAKAIKPAPTAEQAEERYRKAG